jgi:hypothetical protein
MSLSHITEWTTHVTMTYNWGSKQMSQSHITEWATNVTITYNWVSNKCRYMSWWHFLLTQLYGMVIFFAHSVICDGDICCSLSYMSWWHLLPTQLYVMVTFVSRSVICDGDICCSLSYTPSHITEWTTNVTMTYNWVSNRCHLHI